MTDFTETLRLLRRNYNPFKRSYGSYNTATLEINTPKPNKVITHDGLVVKPKISNIFKRPTTQDEWHNFHKVNETGIKKAYENPEGYYIDGNKLFIAGTRDMQDVLDWRKIPMGSFSDSKIYKNVEPVFKDNPQINFVVGHSAGGSATLELEQNHPERNITSVTYAAPVWSRFDPAQFRDDSKKPLRFFHPGDQVPRFDMNAQPVWKAPEYKLDLVKNITNTVTDPSFTNVEKTIESAKDTANFDPLGLHTMSGYAEQSTPMDFVNSGFEGVAVGKAAGII